MYKIMERERLSKKRVCTKCKKDILFFPLTVIWNPKKHKGSYHNKCAKPYITPSNKESTV